MPFVASGTKAGVAHLAVGQAEHAGAGAPVPGLDVEHGGPWA